MKPHVMRTCMLLAILSTMALFDQVMLRAAKRLMAISLVTAAALISNMANTTSPTTACKSDRAQFAVLLTGNQYREPKEQTDFVGCL